MGVATARRMMSECESDLCMRSNASKSGKRASEIGGAF